jgi:hypothetical protein
MHHELKPAWIRTQVLKACALVLLLECTFSALTYIYLPSAAIITHLQTSSRNHDDQEQRVEREEGS